MICGPGQCKPQRKMDRYWCPKCGRPASAPGPRFDPDIFKDFIDAAVRGGQAHEDREALQAICNARMDAGEQEYGPVQFWLTDCAKEAGEEGVDAINWAFLDWTKSLASKDRTDVDDDGRDLALIAACGASIFAAANRIRARRQEE